MILVVCEGWLCHSKVNLMSLFQGVGKSAGRWKVVWSAGWCVLSVMMTPSGVTATHSRILRKKFRWGQWRRWGRWPICASYYEYNATPCVMPLCDALCVQSHAHTGVITMAIALADSGLSAAHHSFVYESISGQLNMCLPRDEASPPHSCVFFTESTSATFSHLSFSEANSPYKCF